MAKDLEILKQEAREKVLEDAKKSKLNEEQTALLIEEAIKEVEANFREEESKVAKKEVKKVEENKKENRKESKKTEKVYMVYTPVKNYNGEVAGIQFAYGKAEVREGWILNWFKEHGYKVEEVSK